jgi:hypothetical protein
MGDENVGMDDVLAEIAAYLDDPDYEAQGYRLTSDIAASMGLSSEKARKRLDREHAKGNIEKVIDRSHRAWWRVKRV